MKPEHIMIDGPAGTKALSGEICAPDYIDTDLAGTIVIMAHDIPFSHSRDHADLFGWLRGVMSEHGYTTLMFDFQSCGESEGREEQLSLETARENLGRVILWAKETGYKHFVFVGCGAAAALLLELADAHTKMALLFWPAVDLKTHARNTLYEDGTISASKGRKIGGDLVAQMEAYDPAPLMKSLKLPVSIHYGDAPETAEQIEFIKNGFNALRIDITSYAGGGPGLADPRHRKMMAHHINAFLQKYA